MKTSYREEDIILLLKDVTGMLAPLDTWEREKRIQSGVHYSEMLPVEYAPSPEYLALYQESIALQGDTAADAAAVCAEKIWREKGSRTVLVSLARAGLPIGILVKRYLEKRYGVQLPHYGISIIRGRGIDRRAMAWLLEKYSPERLQFVDGWVGKGAIAGELAREMERFPGVSPSLAVLADPSGLTHLCGTREDFLIPSSCLNATVSGLISRTILNPKLIGPEDFHGAVSYPELEERDLSYAFIEEIEKRMRPRTLFDCEERQEAPGSLGISAGLQEVRELAERFSISNLHLIKPGIGETTRVLLRRTPWKILVRSREELPYIGHILQLAQEKGVPVEEYPLRRYRACGMIRDLSADV